MDSHTCELLAKFLMRSWRDDRLGEFERLPMRSCPVHQAALSSSRELASALNAMGNGECKETVKSIIKKMILILTDL